MSKEECASDIAAEQSAAKNSACAARGWSKDQCDKNYRPQKSNFIGG